MCENSETRIVPVALGLVSDPPTIVLTYDCVPGAPLPHPLSDPFAKEWKRKRRKRKMPLRDFTDRSNVKRYAFNLRQRHNKYLADVIDVTLEKMLRIIQEIQKGHSLGKSLEVVNKEYSVDPDEDLNALPPAQLAQRKAMMEELFRKNLLKPGDPGYVYDKVVDFDCPKPDTSHDWDDGENESSFNGADKPPETSNANDDCCETDCESKIGGKVVLALASTHEQLQDLHFTNAHDDQQAGGKASEESTGSDAIHAMEQREENDVVAVSSDTPPKNEQEHTEARLNPEPGHEGNDVIVKDSKTTTKRDADLSLSEIEDPLEDIETVLDEVEDEDFWE